MDILPIGSSVVKTVFTSKFDYLDEISTINHTKYKLLNYVQSQKI